MSSPHTAIIEQLHHQLSQHSDCHEALNAMASHGFLTALVVGKELPETNIWLSELLGVESLSAAHKEHLLPIMIHSLNSLDELLNEPEGFDWPIAEADEQHIALEDWCMGFMVAQMLQQAHWFAKDEARVSELLLPIMLGSGLFDEAEAFCDIMHQPDLVEQMLQQVPQVTTELYLYFHG